MLLRRVGTVLLDHTAVFSSFGVACEAFGIDRAVDGLGRLDLRVCGEQRGEQLPTSMGVAPTPVHGPNALADGDIVTTAGTAAGIDVGLHRVRREYDREWRSPSPRPV